MKAALPFLSILYLSLVFFPDPAAVSAVPSLSDEELLDKIQRQSLEFFTAERNLKTGLVRDRADNFKTGKPGAASIASVGFALTAFGVGVSRNWLDREAAREMTRRTLDFFLRSAPQEHGFFYHFLDMETGKRAHRSELSPIDTALFLAGALFAAEFYGDPQIRELAEKIYERVDWPWFLHGGETLALSWSPEEGFNKQRWDHYNESMILYLLAVGSPAHPIPASSWRAQLRPVGSYGPFRLIQFPPLFGHQYSHIWMDFRDKNDGYADYFKNSLQATLANRKFCVDQASRFESYGPNSWGLTASDGPFGYRAYGAPPGWAQHDGTVAPTACGSSIVFTPKESLACLRYFYENLGGKLWGRYGFSDAFNLDRKWFDTEVIGIDQGALLLMIENYRTGLIWKTMSRNAALERAAKAVGFKPGTMAISWPEPPEYRAPYVFGGIQVDGLFKDWPNGPSIHLDRSSLELGNVKDDLDLSGDIRFAWDEKALYFAAAVKDESLVMKKTGKNIWLDDLIEIYIDAKGDGLYWYDKKDFQIGFRPHIEDGGAEVWSWFQGGEDLLQSGQSAARSFVDTKGYWLEGAILWSYLGISPQAVSEIRASVAIHDSDGDRSAAKLHWFFRNEQDFQRFALGKVILEGKAKVKRQKEKVQGKSQK